MSVWIFLGLLVVAYALMCFVIVKAANHVDNRNRRRIERHCERHSVVPGLTSYIDEHERAFIETDSMDEREFMDRAGLATPRKPERAS